MWELWPQCVPGPTGGVSKHGQPAEPAERIPGRGAPEAGERRLLCVLHLYYYCGQSSYPLEEVCLSLFCLCRPFESTWDSLIIALLFQAPRAPLGRWAALWAKTAALAAALGIQDGNRGAFVFPSWAVDIDSATAKKTLMPVAAARRARPSQSRAHVTDGENHMPSDANTQDTWSLDASSNDSDVIMTNGLGQDSSQSNGHSEVSAELDTPHQRNDICLETLYNLYAISVSDDSCLHDLLCSDCFCKQLLWHWLLFFFQCHSGIMGGGHYVTYAKNPNEKWYCYNDSSCKVRSWISLIFGISVSIILHSYCTYIKRISAKIENA